MQPSREAREWGKRQAEKAPPLSEETWRRIGVILDVEFMPAPEQGQDDENNAERAERDAA